MQRARNSKVLASSQFLYWLVAFGIVVIGAAGVGGMTWGFADYPCWDDCATIRQAGSPSGFGEPFLSGVQGSLGFILLGVLSLALPMLTMVLSVGRWALAGVLSVVGIKDGPVAPVGTALLVGVPISQFSDGERVLQSAFVAFAITLVLGSFVAASIETTRLSSR